MSARPPVWAGMLAFLSLAMIFPSVCAGANSADVNMVTFNDPDGVSGDNFGYAVALSGDGATALIGAFGANESSILAVGKAYIYERSYGVWPVQPTVTLVDPGLQTLDEFGTTVALSADGSAAVVSGGFGSKIYVYNKVNGTWSTAPSAVLNDPDSTDGGTYGDGFGSALAISSSGNVVLVGAPFANNGAQDGIGKAYVFVRNNGVWVPTPIATFSDPGNVSFDGFGYSVALSANGATALIGTYHGYLSGGRAFIFMESGSSWGTAPAATFGITGKTDFSGSSVALSSAADVALVGAMGVNDASGPANNMSGTAYIFSGSNGDWITAPLSIFENPVTPSSGFGNAVALSADGTIALIGDAMADAGGIVGLGRTYVFTQSNGVWNASPVMSLTDPDAESYTENDYINDGFGTSVALSSSGQVALIGAPQSPGASPPPPNQVPTHGGPGKAYIYETLDNWANPTPPIPVSHSSGSSGGGSLGWLSLMMLLSALGCGKFLRGRTRR